MVFGDIHGGLIKWCGFGAIVLRCSTSILILLAIEHSKCMAVCTIVFARGLLLTRAVVRVKSARSMR
jgi:hypothetical protein